MVKTSLISAILGASSFKDTIFLKETCDLKYRFDALKKLKDECPEDKALAKEFFAVKKGLAGEDEVAYQLKKANIGMYVLRDVKVKRGDLTAQIDFVVVTPVFTYYIECKNLNGNITVNEKGDFVREVVVDGKKVKKGMYSPLRQVEAQREVIRKIWEDNASKFVKLFGSQRFEYYRRVLVVATNQETILNTTKAPRDIKYKVLRADGLVRQIQYDLQNKDGDSYVSSRKEMEKTAQSHLDLCIKNDVDYYEYYKKKFCKNIVSAEELKNSLVELRKARSLKLKMPAYYIFTDAELEELVNARPKNNDELAKILTPIKVKTHGEAILSIINK